jgi:anthranilate/para-aminobenzoate synthase component I
MMESKLFPFFAGKSIPVSVSGVQHLVGAGEIGPDELGRPVDAPVDVRFGGKMQDHVGSEIGNRLADDGSVTLDRFMDVERFSHVMHLTSHISAKLKPGLDVLDVISATFPAGTVSGAPKVRAMEIIAEMEQAKRGPYAGAIGWLGLDKDAVNLDFGITIRSLWVRDGQVRWQAGAGIVHDSVPEKEWAECRAKAAIMEMVVLDRAFSL